MLNPSPLHAMFSYHVCNKRIEIEFHFAYLLFTFSHSGLPNFPFLLKTSIPITARGTAPNLLPTLNKNNIPVVRIVWKACSWDFFIFHGIPCCILPLLFVPRILEMAHSNTRRSTLCAISARVELCKCGSGWCCSSLCEATFQMLKKHYAYTWYWVYYQLAPFASQFFLY